MKYLVAYDITKTKNRNKLGDLLGKYGDRVNFSVFEIEVNKTQLKKLVDEIQIKELYDKNLDSLRFYHICKNCIPKSFELSNREEIFEEKEMFI